MSSEKPLKSRESTGDSMACLVQRKRAASGKLTALTNLLAVVRNVLNNV